MCIPAQGPAGAGREVHKPEEGAVERFKAQQQAQRGQQQQQQAGAGGGGAAAPQAAAGHAAERRSAAAGTDAAAACASLDAARLELAAGRATIPAAVLTGECSLAWRLGAWADRNVGMGL